MKDFCFSHLIIILYLIMILCLHAILITYIHFNFNKGLGIKKELRIILLDVDHLHCMVNWDM